MLIVKFQSINLFSFDSVKQILEPFKKLFIAALAVFTAFNVVAQNNNQIKFTAKIENRNSDTLIIRGAGNFRQVIPIDKKGVFSANFDAPKGFYMFTDGTESSNLYLKPNSEVNLTMNAKEFDETIVYKGNGVNESNFLAKMALGIENFKKDAFAKEPAEFNSLLEAKIKSETEYVDKSDFDPEFKTAIKNSFPTFNQYTREEYERVYKANKLKGKPSPDFDYVNYKGGKTKLSDLKGKYVYIDLWATWCGPCRAEIPYLQKMEAKYHDKNIEFVSISIDKLSDSEKWKKFVADKNLGGIQLFADKDWQSEFVTSYGVTGIPRFILIDPSGNIVNSEASRPSDPALDSQLSALLK